MCREFYFNDLEILKLSENYVKILSNSIAWWEEILMENNTNIETLLKRVDIFLEDGNWVAAGKGYNTNFNTSDWTDIVDVACYETHTFGLKADGTVVVAVSSDYDMNSWTGMKTTA